MVKAIEEYPAFFGGMNCYAVIIIRAPAETQRFDYSIKVKDLP